MPELTVNVTKMFADRDPWDCSNSVMHMGAGAGRITWENAMFVARDAAEWLPDVEANEPLACDAIRSWAKGTGAWDEEEREGWTETECLALLVQHVASDLRAFGSDQDDLETVAHEYQGDRGGYIMGLEITDNGVLAHVYLGV